ncbi:MAG TPA: VTT domain-containing protein [Gemmatimonadales bacterium]|nr:VTT domain-containing protein [Gemmatimonadales bacterium]
MTDFIAFLEQLPTAPLYALIALLAAVENIFPPVPADVAVSLGAFLSGRGIMNAWLVFALTWTANVASGTAVYALARRHGGLVSRGFLGKYIFTPNTVAHIAEQYRRHGAYGIFVSRLLPVWRAVVMPFAGIAHVPPARALLPMALASGAYYGALTYAISRLGTNLDDVLAFMRQVNAGLAIVAAALVLIIVIWIVRRRLRRPPPPPTPL